jgi:hypothetical protein
MFIFVLCYRYILTKKQWDAKVYGFTFKDEAYEYDLPQTGHFPREAFERWLGKKI